METRLSNEQALLFGLIQADRSPTTDLPFQDVIIALIQAGIDWPALFQAAIHHNLLPGLYHRLSTLPEGTVPTEAAIKLRQLYLTQALHHQRLLDDLLEILEHFQAANIPVIPFKGPAIALQAYGDALSRQFMDLDILIHVTDFQRAIAGLLELGFKPEIPLPGNEVDWFLRAHYHIRLARENRLVELHWAPGEKGQIYPLQEADWWNNLSTLQYQGRSFSVLSPENTFLVTCLHGTANHWSKLKWIDDVTRLLQLDRGIDWEKLLLNAQQKGFYRIIGMGIGLAEQLTGAHLPEIVQITQKPDPETIRLCEVVVADLWNDPGSGGAAANAAFYLRCRERGRDRFYYDLDQIFVPKLADWSSIPLPLPLFPLYHGLRPLRLLTKFIPLLFKST